MGPSRREFLKSAGVAGAMAVTGGRARPVVAGAQTESGATVLRSIRTEVLDIGYEETGDPAGFPIILLHGFPYDIRSWDGVVPPLADAGYRVLVPYLRGYGTTSFVDPEAPRMAEQAAIAQDVSDFADALGLDQVALAGFDWGNRAACITSILHPERVRAQVAIGGYSVQDTISPSAPSPSAAAEARLWYQWYFNTERGRAGLEANRHSIVRYLWETWSPTWEYTDEAYNRSAPAFDNPDFVDVVIHSYRHRRTATRPARNASWKPSGSLPSGRRSRCRPSCCAATTAVSGGRRPTLRRTGLASPISSPGASSTGRDTIWRRNGPRPCRRRCWNCWRRTLAAESCRCRGPLSWESAPQTTPDRVVDVERCRQQPAAAGAVPRSRDPVAAAVSRVGGERGSRELRTREAPPGGALGSHRDRGCVAGSRYTHRLSRNLKGDST